MSRKQVIISKEAPAAIGPYSQAISCGGMLFISGQLPIDPVDGNLVEGEIGNKTKRAMDNIGAVLKSVGLDFENLVKVTIYTTKIEEFQQINAAYSQYFKEDPPARAVVGVASLPKGADIEIEGIATFK